MLARVPPPGSVIGDKYRVESLIGAGGMGVVVEATHMTLGQRVAVKIFGPVEQSDRALSRFLHEARMAAQLPGDHIGRALDIGRTERGEAYIVMELLVGRDLRAELRAHRRIPVREAVDWILQACEGTAEAHAVGLVHCDLKPENLFLSLRRDGSRLVKVLDFGISKWSVDAGGGPSKVTVRAVGTPAYMAPEQFAADGVVDARCDQHALAVVLFELIAGARPYEAEGMHALAFAIQRRPARSLALVSAEAPTGLDLALARALSKSPKDRFTDLAAFAAAIALYGGEGAAASARNVAAILASASLASPGELTRPSIVAFAVEDAREIDFSSEERTRKIPTPSTERPSHARRVRTALLLGLGVAFVGMGVGSRVLEAEKTDASLEEIAACPIAKAPQVEPQDAPEARVVAPKEGEQFEETATVSTGPVAPASATAKFPAAKGTASQPEARPKPRRNVFERRR